MPTQGALTGKAQFGLDPGPIRACYLEVEPTEERKLNARVLVR
jgi:hypothetical protein